MAGTTTRATVSDVRARLDAADEFALLDVRREGDFATGHILLASNLPVALIELRLGTLVPRRTTPIIVCDADVDRALAAAETMARMGYHDVAVLDGGVAAWTAAGHQLFSGINVPSKAFGEFVEHRAGTPHIDPRDLAVMIERGADLVVLDSRPLGEFQTMSIPGAIDCPGGELVYRFFENVPSPDALVVVNCAGRTRSIIGAQSLIDAQVPNRIVALRDGTMGWHLAGLALDRGRSRRARAPGEAALERARQHAHAVARRAEVPRATWDDVRASQAEEGRTTYLFDVRDGDEFQLSHPAGAISAPGGQLVQTLDAFAAVRGARVFLCDADGVRGAMAAAWLKQMGWADVFHVTDGLAGAPLAVPTPAAAQSDARAIEPAVVGSLIDAGRAVVLDLADSKEYRRRHLAPALFCERDALAAALASLAPEQIVLLTSPDGRLAQIAAEALTLPVSRLQFIAGGTGACARAGLAMASGRGNLPDRPTDVFYRPYDNDRGVETAMRQYLDWEVSLIDRLEGEPGVRFRRI
jgi:rhodanese-related sulfurtransferase